MPVEYVLLNKNLFLIFATCYNLIMEQQHPPPDDTLALALRKYAPARSNKLDDHFSREDLTDILKNVSSFVNTECDNPKCKRCYIRVVGPHDDVIDCLNRAMFIVAQLHGINVEKSNHVLYEFVSDDDVAHVQTSKSVCVIVDPTQEDMNRLSADYLHVVGLNMVKEHDVKKSKFNQVAQQLPTVWVPDLHTGAIAQYVMCEKNLYSIPFVMDILSPLWFFQPRNRRWRHWTMPDSTLYDLQMMDSLFRLFEYLLNPVVAVHDFLNCLKRLEHIKHTTVFNDVVERAAKMRRL